MGNDDIIDFLTRRLTKRNVSQHGYPAGRQGRQSEHTQLVTAV